jgi:lipopolysaccharide biosynthesis protein
MINAQYSLITKRLWLFAHFNPFNEISEHVILALHKYREFGGTIAFSSTSMLDGSARDKLAGIVDHIFVRPNVGLDFSSWKYALDQLGDITQYDEIIIVNDSIVGPLFSLNRALVNYNPQLDRVFGMTISNELNRHIQSYFIIFNMKILPKNIFDSFWDKVVPLESKQEIINKYEIGLSVFLIEQGIALKSAYDMNNKINNMNFIQILGHLQFHNNWLNLSRFKRIIDGHIRRLGNPTHFQWKEILNHGVPYIKIELLLSNPQKLPQRPILKILESLSPEMYGAITEYYNKKYFTT